MGAWAKYVELNCLFHDGISDPIDDPEGFKNLKRQIVEALSESKLFPVELVDKFKGVRSLTGLENALNLVYDHADNNQIWLGLC